MMFKHTAWLAVATLVLAACQTAGPGTADATRPRDRVPTIAVRTRPPPRPTPVIYTAPTRTPAAFAGRLNGEQWLTYLKRDLMPFWDHGDAWGEPLGRFPSVRCDDGTAPRWSAPCPEVAGNGWLRERKDWVVSISRQVYGYGVAFHMTGDTRYLKGAKAGVDFLRKEAFDRKAGGVFHYYDPNKRAWGPEAQYRDPQQLAYALLGISFYYYLTRDGEVLSDIVDTHDYIMRNYFNADDGALQWLLEDTGNEKARQLRLTAQLDQLNAYMVLVTPLLPAEQRAEWQATMLKLTGIIQTRFYSAEDNLVFLKATTTDEVGTQNAETDFGHTIKSFWMMRFVALQTGDAELQKFAETNALRMLDRAFLRDTGSWASSVKQGGEIDASKQWWIYNELDQYAASVAIEGPDAPTVRAYLDKTNPWYMRYFVDQTDGEVWSSLTADGAIAPDSLPKKWPWKSAYHSLEHALVGYITAQAIDRQPLTLYYGFGGNPNPASVRPYFYRGTLQRLEATGGVWRATFTEVK
jgi:mannose/cellobiose epimerase-like protein (N-acyl-D-glucosamine 2-epimerase family)